VNFEYLNGYPDYMGRRFAFVCKATGPKSYSTSGYKVKLPGFQHYTDHLPGHVFTVSGTYFLRFYPSIAARRVVYTAHWYAVSGGAEVSAAVDLSGETCLIGGFGGQS
jgi:hypothetical protein